MKVLELNNSNVEKFNKIMNDKKQKAIFKVWAPWCDHCIKLNKIWPSIINDVKKTPGDGILVGVSEAMVPYVNCIDSREVQGYPWIFSMKGGGSKKIEYKGNRDKDSLVKYIKKKLSECNTKKQIQKGGRKKRKTRRRKKKTNKRSRKKKRRKSESRIKKYFQYDLP